MITACLDLEGVIFPEIWINVAEKTGIKELKLTTKDISDYDELMQMRIRILKEKNINIHLIKDVIAALTPLDGAYEFINWLRERFQVIILSDTFYQFAMPLMKQIGYPALFCHNLIIDETGMITGYKLRQKSAKREVVKALKNDLLIKTIALGDSYNDTQMLAEADAGILFSPPQNVINEFPQFSVTYNYKEAKERFIEASKVIQ